MNVTPLADLLSREFSEWPSLPADCWVRRAIERNHGGFEIGTAVEAALFLGLDAAIAARLRLEHPSGRPHHSQHDDGILNAFTEIEAIAWASQIAQLGAPEFVNVEGAPDLRISDTHWIEAKTIRSSDRDRNAWEEARQQAAGTNSRPIRSGAGRGADPQVVMKFEAYYQNAFTKWKRQNCALGYVVFYCLERVDADMDREGVWEMVTEWVKFRKTHTPEIRLIVIDNHRWGDPMIDSHLL